MRKPKKVRHRHFASVTAKSFIVYTRNSYPSKYGMPKPELYETHDMFLAAIRKRVPEFREENIVVNHVYMIKQVMYSKAVPKMVNAYMNLFLVNDLYPLLGWYGMTDEEIEELYSEFTVDETSVQ